MKRRLFRRTIFFIVVAVVVVFLTGIFKGKIFKYKERPEFIRKLTNQVHLEPRRIKNKNEFKVKMCDRFKNVAPFENAKSHLEIPTYVQGDNQLLHPSVLYNPSKKFGYTWIMGFTPYSYANDATENPSIVVSEDGENWNVPKGLKNPLVKTDRPGQMHYSDTEIISNGKELELWYRQSDKVKRESRILRQKSTDTVHWSEPEVIFDYGTGGYGYGAPTIIYDEGNYEIYYRDHMSFGKEGYVKINYKDNQIVGEKIPINFEYEEEYKGFVAWHIEVIKVDNTYYATTMSYPPDRATDGTLFLFTSADGINFSDMKVMVKPSENGFDNGNIYRSSLVVANNFVNLYYSSISKNNECYTSLISVKE